MVGSTVQVGDTINRPSHTKEVTFTDGKSVHYDYTDKVTSKRSKMRTTVAGWQLLKQY